MKGIVLDEEHFKEFISRINGADRQMATMIRDSPLGKNNGQFFLEENDVQAWTTMLVAATEYLQENANMLAE